MSRLRIGKWGAGRPSVSAPLVLLGIVVGFGPSITATDTLPPPRAEHKGVWVERARALMGTRLHLRVRSTDRRAGIWAIDAAIAAAQRHETLLSSWTQDSEISAINRAKVTSVVGLSDDLNQLLAEAVHWSEETGGAFQPIVGALVDSWGTRSSGRIPRGSELSAALSAVGAQAIDLDLASATAMRRDRDAWIDTGGFGKGAALRGAVQALVAAGVEDAMLDFGGQLIALGSEGGTETGWLVSVAHPDRRFEPAVQLRLSGVSVATSGASERNHVVDGRQLSHIIDPREGLPVVPWGSVTVVSEDAFAADAVATALFVLGPEAGMSWAEERTDLGILFLVKGGDGKLKKMENQKMAQWLESPKRLRGSRSLVSRQNDS